MSKIAKITYSQDYMDCETCGSEYAESVQIEIDGKVFGSLASASCFGNIETTGTSILKEYLISLGYQIEETSIDLGDGFDYE